MSAAVRCRALLAMEHDVRAMPPQLAAVSAYLQLASRDAERGLEARECQGLHEIVWTLYEQAERVLAVFETGFPAAPVAGDT